MANGVAGKSERASEGILGWLSWSLLAVGIIAVVAGAFVWEPSHDLPVRRKIPPFELNDQDGGKVSLDTLRGKIWVGTFMFTTCRNACPAMAAELLRFQNTIRNESALEGRLRLVSFTLDPGNDTPQRLAEYSKQQGIDSRIWSFLRGERQDIARLCEEGFGLSAGGGREPAGPALGVPHSDRFVLVDGGGAIRGYYRPSAVAGDLEKLIEAARLLLEEDREG